MPKLNSPTALRMMLRIKFCLPLMLLIGFHQSATAQWDESDQEALAKKIEAAVENLDPERFPEFTTSGQEVLTKVKQVRAYFQRSTDAKNAAAWMDYLDVDPIVDAIDSEKSAAEIGRAARSLRFRLISPVPGLELRPLVELRDSVEKLLNSLLFRDGERNLELISRQLKASSNLIREIEGDPTSDQSITLSALTRVIAGSGQSVEVIEALRNAFDKPNFALQIDGKLIQKAVERDVNEPSPVRDCILGTRLIGQAFLSGRVTTELIPSDHDARLRVRLDGRVSSRNTGFNGPIRLRTVSDGNVIMSRQIILSEAGLSIGPTQSESVSLATKITAIEHPLALVRRIARQQAAKKKGQSDRIALQRMRDQVGQQFSEETDAAVAGGTPAFKQLNGVIKRLSLEEPKLQWSSSESALSVQAVLRRPDQLATLLPKPQLDGDHAVVIQIHESFVDNMLAPMLSGRTVRERELNRLLDRLGIELEPPTQATEGEEKPFRIDFARLRPIIFEARANQLRVGVRGTRFVQGDRELNQAMEITAVYTRAIGEDGHRLTRDGNVEVNFSGRKRISIAQAGMRRTIEKKFSALFPEMILAEPVDVPEDSDLESMRGTRFRVGTVTAERGWLSVGVR